METQSLEELRIKRRNYYREYIKTHPEVYERGLEKIKLKYRNDDEYREKVKAKMREYWKTHPEAYERNLQRVKLARIREKKTHNDLEK